MASLVPWHPEQLPPLEGLPRTPDHCPSPLFCFFWILLQMQTHRCPVEYHFHGHVGSTTANTTQSAEATFAVGPIAGSHQT